MTEAGKETVKVEGYERRKPTSQPKRRDNESKISDRLVQGQQPEGVKTLSRKGDGPQGVERLSRREPGQLETTVELSTDQSDRDEDGRRRFR